MKMYDGDRMIDAYDKGVDVGSRRERDRVVEYVAACGEREIADAIRKVEHWGVKDDGEGE